MLLSHLSEILEGRHKGRDVEILGASTLEEAGQGDITFLSNPKYAKKVSSTRADAIIVGEELETDIPQIIVNNAYLGFAKILHILYPEKQHEKGISPRAYVHPKAKIDPSSSIYPNVYVGAGSIIGQGSVIYPGCFIGDDVNIGQNTVLHANIAVYDGCSIGKDCIIHAGAVIGSDGFGFVWDGTEHVKIPQKGTVIIGDHVEIGSNCTIDRAALTKTIIGSDVKMDNLVQIGHNVTIGDHTIIVAQSGVAGSSHIGRSVVLAAQSGVGGHIDVGDCCVAGARTGIVSDLGPGKVVSGYPAMDHKHWLRSQKVYKDLPDLLKRIRNLERRIHDRD